MRGTKNKHPMAINIVYLSHVRFTNNHLLFGLLLFGLLLFGLLLFGLFSLSLSLAHLFV
jgi:hypothetical protein